MLQEVTTVDICNLGNVEVIRKCIRDVPEAYWATTAILPISIVRDTANSPGRTGKKIVSNTTRAFVDVVRNYQLETKGLLHIPMA